MEEIRGTEALEREILDDSSKRAERIGKKARDEAERVRRQAAEELEAKIAGLEKKFGDKSASTEKERASRLPLERTRLRAAFVDRALSDAMKVYLSGLSDAKVADWCASQLASRAKLFSGAHVVLRHKGLPPEGVQAMRTALSAAASLELEPDPDLPRRGIVAEDGDERVRVTLTEAQMEEQLLGARRGELARALLPSEFAGARGETEKR